MISIVDDGDFTPQRVDAIVEEVHRAVEAGETIAVPNPHYAGPLLPQRLIAPVLAAAAKRNLTPDEFLEKAVTAYLQPA